VSTCYTTPPSLPQPIQALGTHHLNRTAQTESRPLDVLDFGPAVGIARSALALALFAPTAVVKDDAKHAALGGLAVLSPVFEGLERVSIADAHVGGGGIVEGTVGVLAEAVVVVSACHGEGRRGDEERGDLLLRRVSWWYNEVNCGLFEGLPGSAWWRLLERLKRRVDVGCWWFLAGCWM
jgi:hypothetical protein